MTKVRSESLVLIVSLRSVFYTRTTWMETLSLSRFNSVTEILSLSFNMLFNWWSSTNWNNYLFSIRFHLHFRNLLLNIGIRNYSLFENGELKVNQYELTSYIDQNYRNLLSSENLKNKARKNNRNIIDYSDFEKYIFTQMRWIDLVNIYLSLSDFDFDKINYFEEDS